MSPPTTADVLLALFDQVVALFHHLKRVAEVVHGQGELSAGRRGVLRGLERLGPQTVPRMARARPVSRQHIQTLVDELLAEGLVTQRTNPAHKRSVLIALTAGGGSLLKAMDRRERRALKTVRLSVSRQELQRAGATLRTVREQLEPRPGAPATTARKRGGSR